MSEMGVKSINDHGRHLISLFHGESRWSWCSLHWGASNPCINPRAEFLSLWGFNVGMWRREKPQICSIGTGAHWNSRFGESWWSDVLYSQPNELYGTDCHRSEAEYQFIMQFVSRGGGFIYLMPVQWDYFITLHCYYRSFNFRQKNYELNCPILEYTVSVFRWAEINNSMTRITSVLYHHQLVPFAFSQYIKIFTR